MKSKTLWLKVFRLCGLIGTARCALYRLAGLSVVYIDDWGTALFYNRAGDHIFKEGFRHER